MHAPSGGGLILYQAYGNLYAMTVPIPLPDDPYEAIRQAFLDGTVTEFEPFEDTIETETPESPLTVAPPTSLPESTPPTLVPILRRTARMAVRVPHAMSSGISASMAEVAAMTESMFLKDDEEDDDEEDEEIEESLDSNSIYVRPRMKDDLTLMRSCIKSKILESPKHAK
ncbi:hypothetical protein Tco_0730375 [Tanacetum coccineum]|uniref:Uncharacterized protein n=1 Tax=Tanacetum coccineum TaxID=301880 RepID=A0ABQ4YRK7_9ASTR